MSTIPLQGPPQRPAARLTERPAHPRPVYQGLFQEPLYSEDVAFLDEADSSEGQVPTRMPSRSRR